MLSGAGHRGAAAPALLLAALAACGGLPCRGQGDCPPGHHCVLELGGVGAPAGECRFDCAGAEDCPAPADASLRAICSDEGRCGVAQRLPRLRLREPEPGAVYPAGTRRIRVSGELETAAAGVELSVSVAGSGGCVPGPPVARAAVNPRPGRFSAFPFVLDDVEVEPGPATVTLEVGVGAARRVLTRAIEVECAGCPVIELAAPRAFAAVSGLTLPLLAGTVRPGTGRPGLWRVRGADGQVLDGRLRLAIDGGFALAGLPLFAGDNRVEVLARGEGGEARCSAVVTAGLARERGLRVLLQWDSPSADLDLHLVAPGGRFGDPATSLSPRGRAGVAGGAVVDATAGPGPEVLSLAAPGEGVFGLVVEPVVDGPEGGASATARVLLDGRLAGVAPEGPVHLSAERGELWVVGVIERRGGELSWVPLGEVLPASRPPSRPPSAWPTFH